MRCLGRRQVLNGGDEQPASSTALKAVNPAWVLWVQLPSPPLPNTLHLESIPCHGSIDSMGLMRQMHNHAFSPVCAVCSPNHWSMSEMAILQQQSVRHFSEPLGSRAFPGICVALWALPLLLSSGFCHRLNPFHGRLKLLGVANATQEHWTRIEAGKAAKITVGLRQWGTSRHACCGDHRGQLNGKHATAG